MLVNSVITESLTKLSEKSLWKIKLLYKYLKIDYNIHHLSYPDKFMNGLDE